MFFIYNLVFYLYFCDHMNVMNFLLFVMMLFSLEVRPHVAQDELELTM